MVYIVYLQNRQGHELLYILHLLNRQGHDLDKIFKIIFRNHKYYKALNGNALDSDIYVPYILTP